MGSRPLIPFSFGPTRTAVRPSSSFCPILAIDIAIADCLQVIVMVAVVEVNADLNIYTLVCVA